VLTSVNADTTWLLQLPIPSSSVSDRKWFNVILDPWLTGPQSDVASWFSRQWHVEPPACGTISAVEELCAKVEYISQSSSSSSSTSGTATPLKLEKSRPHIDAIAISHEFTDHCHKETLLACDPSTPVIASTKAAALVKGWKHFNNVIETPGFTGDWTTIASLDANGQSVLPDWLKIGRVVTKSDALYYHSAVLIAFQLGDSQSPIESVIYTPHGIHAKSLVSLTESSPPIKTLALLHGLHDVSIDWGQQLNLGAHNGLAAQQALGAKYWVGTHDEVKKGGGVVSWFLRRKVISVKQALEQLGEGKMAEETNFVELGNGKSLLLQ
jgi:hypothetical protein